MSQVRRRRWAAPWALVTLIAFCATLMPPRVAAAQSAPPPPSATDPIADGTGGPSSLTLPTPGAETPDAKTTVDLTTGAAKSHFGFHLPKARGDAQPSLALTYNSTVGLGFAGVGWTLSLPSIVRRGAAGLPRFTNDVFTAAPSALAAPNATFDDYLADGQLLVPICLVSGCTQLQAGERLPSALAGSSLGAWMYFRREVDDGARYFFSPDGQTWLKQEKTGHVTQFGRPLDSSTVPAALSDGIERPASFTNFVSPIPAGTAVYRWNIVRETDASSNTVYYAWTNNASLSPGGTFPDIKYLSDIYDTPAVGQGVALNAFAHHVHLSWQLNFPLPQVTTDVPPLPTSVAVNSFWNPTQTTTVAPLQIFSPIWRAPPFAQLTTVDVTSASWSSTARGLVRRYTLGYQSNYWNTRNRLTTVTLEGECSPTPGSLRPIPETNNVIPQPSGCGNASVLQLAQYSYYPDTTSGGAPSFASLGTAFSSSNPTSEPTLAMGFMQDVNGDGAAEYLSPPITGTSFNVQSFAATSATALSTPDLPRLLPSYSAQSCYSTPGPNGELNGQCLSYHPMIFGDWLANGATNWLTFDGSGSSQGPPPTQPWNVYSPSAGVLTPTGISGGHCAGNDYCDNGRAFDVDGDGLTDMSLLQSRVGTSSFVTQRAHDGSIVPFSLSLPPDTGWEPPSPVQSFRSVADMDGDGLPDIMTINQTCRSTFPTGLCSSGQFGWAIQTWTNRGDGTFGAGLDPMTQTRNPFTTYYEGLTPTPAPGGLLTRMADVNGDGFADNVQLNKDSVSVVLRTGAYPWASTFYGNDGVGANHLTIPLPALSGTIDASRSMLEIADIDGTGVPRILVSRYAPGSVDPVVYETSLIPGTLTSPGGAPSGTFPGLLKSVTRLGLAQEQIFYEPLSNEIKGTGTVPVSAWVVSQLMTNNGMPSSSPLYQSESTIYRYSGAVYDPREKAVVGFRTAEEIHAYSNGAPILDRTTLFLTSACGPASATSCTGQVDYGYMRAVRGLVAAVDDRATSPNGTTELKTTIDQYQEHRPYAGLDGRIVRKLPLLRQKTYLWDPNKQAANGNTPVTAVLNTTSTYYESAWSATVGATVVPIPANTTQTRVQVWDEDDLGNQLDTVDFGQPGVDTPIRTDYQWKLPGGDATGWGFRAITSHVGYTTDQAGTTIASPPARSYSSTYDSLGRLTAKSAALTGEPVAMGPPAFAATPPNPSTNGPVALSALQYDSYGNVIQNAGPGARCSAVTYDPLFSQFPQSSRAYTSGCGSANPLQTTHVFDRGLEQVTQETAPAAGGAPRITRKKYDPFGRIVEIDQPSATLAGTTDPAPALKVLQYNDTAATRYVYFQTVDGPPRGTPTYQDHYRYVDGYDDVVAVIDQAINPDGAMGWISSGGHTRYGDGRIHQVYQPVENTGSPASASFLSDVGQLQVASTTYDGLGRVLTKTDFRGNVSTYSYQFGLPNAAAAVTVQDPEQNPPANPGAHHAGSYTTTFSDGHGRQTQTDQYLNAVSAGSGHVVTTTTYAATGERQAIGQTLPTGTYRRTMQYDTLGRMVSQSEPNVGTWQYAYNDAGDLVGKMDARGCGEVLYHDGLGRVTAEDYAPCDSSQPAYSAPNLSTGDGTEAFYAYDAYGALSSEVDRAQRSSYMYDPRGRMTREQRQIAVPGGSDSLSGRYAPRVYTKGSLSYSQANRLLVSTTGSDLPDLAVGGTSLVTASYSVQGTLASVSSSYGTLLSNVWTDASNRIVGQSVGDAASTKVAIGYDENGAVAGYVVERDGTYGGPSTGHPPWATYTQNGTATPGQNTYQTVLTSLKITRDLVGNPVEMDEALQFESAGPIGLPPITPSEWPTGSAPTITKTMAYGDDYRMQSVAATYAGKDLTSYAGPNDSAFYPYTPADVPLFPPQPSTGPGLRVRNQQYGYDWRGNLMSSSDDANVFFDRSLGTIVSSGADRLGSASFGAANGNVPGSLTATHDVAGNVIAVDVQGGPSYTYEWDEVGRLMNASRTDPNGARVNETNTYDATGQRVGSGVQAGTSSPELHTLQVFDSLVLKNAAFGASGTADYDDSDATEALYLRAGGLLVGHAFYAETPLPSASAGKVHVFMPLTDPLGSTSFVIDHDTGELVEATTYQPYGAVESDYRPSRWASFREDVRYTGHWDSAEVGLVYMNARYYSPQLGRFISPDPQTIHVAKGDLNPYAYTKGSPYRYTDPTGLGEGCWYGCDTTKSSPDPRGPFVDTNTDPDKLGTMRPVWDESGNPFAYSPGNDTTLTPVLTPGQVQDERVAEFAFVGSVTATAFLAPTVAPAEHLNEMTSILEEHLDTALKQYAATGLTDAQTEAVIKNPALQAAAAGDRIDQLFKANVIGDSRCAGLCVTPRGVFGPDVFSSGPQLWWDVTTVGQWQAHLIQYSGGYGTGTPLLYGGVTGGP